MTPVLTPCSFTTPISWKGTLQQYVGRLHRLQSVAFDWRKQGNAKIPSWDNTILGNIKISGHTMVAEVNSKNRADRLCKEISSRLGRAAALDELSAATVEEMLAKTPKQSRTQRKQDDELGQALLDPEARSHLQQIIQKQVDDWVHLKVPALGGRTPLQAVAEPDGQEIVESLLLDWERRAAEGLYQAGIRPDFNAIRKLLNLTPATS
jgi:hypothetical protein